MEKPIRFDVDRPPGGLPDLGDAPSAQQPQQAASPATPPAAAIKAPTPAAARSSGRSLGSAYGRLSNGGDFETGEGFRSAIAQGKGRAEGRRALEESLQLDEDHCRQWWDEGIARRNSIMRRRAAEEAKGKGK